MGDRVGARVWPALRFVLVDFVAPVLAALATTWAIFHTTVTDLDRLIIGPGAESWPGDLNGTVWFYGWMDHVVTNGLPILRSYWVCWPYGQNLGGSFPNRVDAWLAMPFMHFLSLPRSINVYTLFIPVLATLAGYAFLRALTPRWPLALAGAVVFGFERYLFYEVAGGRLVTAMIVTLPLFLAGWVRAVEATRARSAVGWAVIAGLCAALVSQSYAPWTMWVGAVAVAFGLARLVVPPEGVGRLRLLGVALLTLAVAAVALISYVHENAVIRPVPGYRLGDPLPPWDPRVWTETWAYLQTPSNPPPPSPQDGVDAPKNLAAINALWDPEAPGGHRATLPWLTPFALAFAAALGGRAAFAWAVLGMLGWASLAGAHPDRLLVEAPAWIRSIGPYLPSPTAWVLDAAPGLAHHLRPYRGAPVATLAIVASIVVGCDQLARRALARRWGWIVAGVAFLVPISLAGLTVQSAMEVDARRVQLHRWAPSPFYETLRAIPPDAPGGGAVIDLPMGLGHAFGAVQVIHRHARADFAQDSYAVGYGGRAPEPQAWIRPLRALGLQGQPLPPSTWKDAARADGFSWVLVHLDAYRSSGVVAIPMDPKVVVAWLESELGPPTWKDATLVAFAL